MSSLKQELKESFPQFLKAIWHEIGLPKPTKVQLDIARFMQSCPARSGVEAFRGVGKSFIASAFCVWHWYRDKDFKILVVSASKDRADGFARFTRKLIADIRWLQHLQPHAGQTDSMLMFDVGGCRADQSASMRSIGITGQITGSRADLIIADDCETLNNSCTQVQRDKLGEQIKEFDAVIKPLPHAKILYLGTPQTEMSIYNGLALDRGYTFRIWPSLYPTDKQIGAYGSRLAPLILRETHAGNVGLTTDPARFTDSDLESRKLSYGKAGFELQFMLNTSLSDADKYPLSCRKLMVHPVSQRESPSYLESSTLRDFELDLECVGLRGDRWYKPSYISDTKQEYTSRILAIDPSGSGDDETSYAVGYFLNGYIFLVESGGFTDGFGKGTLTALSRIAKRHKVNEVIVEKNYGGGMFSQLLTPVLFKEHKCVVEEVTHSVQKERRIIDTLRPVLDDHRLIVDPKVILSDLEADPKRSVFYQLTRVTYEKGSLVKDDRLDALSILVARFVDMMNLDAKKEEKKRYSDMMDAELEEIYGDLVGSSDGGQNQLGAWGA